MRPQLIHLVLCTVLASLTGSARANDEDDEQSRQFKRLFDDTSEPLEPEEARKLIAQQYAVHAGRSEPTDPSELKEFQTRATLLKDLINFERFAQDCDGDLFWLVDRVALRVKKHPALKDYFNDRRDHRLLDSCNETIVARLKDYTFRALLTNDNALEAMMSSTLDSLGQVPAQVVLGENWLKSKNDQVSAALYAVMLKHRSFFKRFSSSDRNFGDLFDDTVWKVCQRLPKWPLELIIPSYMADYFVREAQIDQLDQKAVYWQKLARTCKLIRFKPTHASNIVFDYKNKQKKEGEQQGKQCKEQHDCL